MTVQTDANQNHAPGFIEEQAAFLTALAEHGIPTDVQELLLAGDGRGGIAPGALRMALAAVMARPRTPVGERGALKEACAAMEYWAGCEEGVAQDVASSEIMSAGGAWPATAYEKARHVLSLPANGDAPFQSRVQPWLLACFGETIAVDRQERNHRFLEESLELVQAAGCTASEAHQLVDYVFGRDVGEPAQEVGGVMVTLAALCLANGLDMHEAGEVELARIWTKVEAIRAKQAAKPKHSPLPMAAAPAVPEIDNPARWFFTFSEDAEWWYLGGATYEAALEKAEREREGRPIYLQQAKRMVPKLEEVALADNVIDAIADDECWGEDGWEGQGDTPELQRRLDGAVAGWFAECCELTGAHLDFIGECKVISAEGGPAA